MSQGNFFAIISPSKSIIWEFLLITALLYFRVSSCSLPFILLYLAADSRKHWKDNKNITFFRTKIFGIDSIEKKTYLIARL